MDIATAHDASQQVLQGATATQIIAIFFLGVIFITVMFVVMFWMMKLVIKPFSDKLDSLAKNLDEVKENLKGPLSSIQSDAELAAGRRLAIAEHINTCENKNLFESISIRMLEVIKENTEVFRELSNAIKNIHVPKTR